ncbi:MAG: ABC transporter permease [Anaerolineales bacterium]|nr:ABC transporter permease [Anaerolineales bacterium]
MLSIKKLNIYSSLQKASGLILLILVGVIFALLSDRFLTLSNLSNIFLQTSVVAVATIGMTLTMLMAGIDLSVGSIAAFSGAIVAGLMTRNGLSMPAAITLGILIGAGLGAVNGVLTVHGKLPPFVATLAMLGVARGLTLVYTQGRPISGLDQTFTFLGSGNLGPVPMPVVIWLIILLVVFLVLRYTKFGLYIYAIGGNQETARLAGIPTKMIMILVYAISGGLASITGILLTARLWSAQPQMAAGLELDAIAASVIGGVSLFGGVGSVVGACMGALIVGMLGNGLNLLRIPSYYQQVIKGVVFVVAVILDMFTKRRSKQ